MLFLKWLINVTMWGMYVCRCRFEAENSFLRAQNIFSNRRAPSRDICRSFAVISDLCYICSGGYIQIGQRHRYFHFNMTCFLLLLISFWKVW